MDYHWTNGWLIQYGTFLADIVNSIIMIFCHRTCQWLYLFTYNVLLIVIISKFITKLFILLGIYWSVPKENNSCNLNMKWVHFILAMNYYTGNYKLTFRVNDKHWRLHFRVNLTSFLILTLMYNLLLTNFVSGPRLLPKSPWNQSFVTIYSNIN